MGPPKNKPLSDRSLSAGDLRGVQTKYSTARRVVDDTSERVPLGIYAVNYSPSTAVRVSEDGEILDVPRSSRAARAERYALKSAASV